MEQDASFRTGELELFQARPINVRPSRMMLLAKDQSLCMFTRTPTRHTV